MENETQAPVKEEAQSQPDKGATPLVNDNKITGTVTNNGPEFPENTPVESMTLEQQAAYWKSMARKHESREKALNKQIAESNGDDLKTQVADLQARLAERDLEDARKDVRLAHPEITDEIFADLCHDTDPQAVREWGDKMAKAMQTVKEKPMPTPSNPQPQHSINPVTRVALAAAAQNNSAEPHVKGESRQSAYEKARKQYTPNPEK